MTYTRTRPMPAPATDPLLGTIVDGRYRIDELVGQGGFGTVYAAFHLSLGIKLAFKRLSLPPLLDHAMRAKLIADFMEEARVVTKLRHPNVVSVLDLGVLAREEDGPRTPYIVMEWCGGTTLERLLAERGRFSTAEALALFEPIVDAIAHAHEQNIIHRDLKPGNVMVVQDAAGRLSPRVIDFGVAKLVDEGEAPGSGETRSKLPSAYTPAYAAPEQVGHGRTGPWTDVHALGLLFVELVSGAPPYAFSKSMLPVIDPVRPTPSAHGVLAGAVEGVIARATRLRPDERFADAGALCEALRSACVAGRALGTAPTEQAPVRMPAPLRERRVPRLVVFVAAAMVAVAGLGVVLAGRDHGHRSDATDTVPSPPTETAPPVETALAPPAHVGPAVAASRVCDLPAEVLKGRAARAGLTVDMWNDVDSIRLRTASFRDGQDVLTLELTDVADLPTPPEERLHEQLRRIAQRVDVTAKNYPGAAYGVQGTCRIVLSGPRKSGLAGHLAVLAAGATFDSQGDTVGGADPAHAALKEQRTGTLAKRLSELSPEELESRVRKTGEPVTFVTRSPSTVTITLERHPAFGSCYFMRGAGDPEALAKSFATGQPGFGVVYVAEDPVVLLCYGSSPYSDVAFLKRIVAGLPGEPRRIP